MAVVRGGYTFALAYPQRENTQNVMSEERGGHLRSVNLLLHNDSTSVEGNSDRIATNFCNLLAIGGGHDNKTANPALLSHVSPDVYANK